MRIGQDIRLQNDINFSKKNPVQWNEIKKKKEENYWLDNTSLHLYRKILISKQGAYIFFKVC